MLEPRPEMVRLPQVEPVLRVGVVLPEDKKQRLWVEATDEGCALTGSERRLLVRPGESIEFALEGATITASLGQQTLHSTAFTLEAPDGQALSPNRGFIIRSAVVGRGFHWRKQVDLCFPGALQISALEDFLVITNRVPFETYIACVVSSEMGAECPQAFINAQATAARSWAMTFLHHKHTDLPYTICNDDDCQRYQGTTYASDLTLDAVKTSRGRFIVTEKGHICPAYYSKSCGGHSEDVEAAFGFSVEGITGISDTAEKKIAA